MIRVLIADDHPVVRAGLRALLDVEPDIEVVGDAATPDEAVEAASALRPAVVLMDLRFGPDTTGTDPTGADATRSVRALPDAPAVLVLTNYDTDADILGAVEAGASGYLLKDAPPAELLAAVRAAAAGATALAPAIAARLLERVRAPRDDLSPREVEVLQLVAAGATNAVVARTLFLSEPTVKTHLVHAYTKLGVSSRTAAVAEARRLGVIR